MDAELDLGEQRLNALLDEYGDDTVLAAFAALGAGLSMLGGRWKSTRSLMVLGALSAETGVDGMIDASATRTFGVPRSRRSRSTGASAVSPSAAVPAK